MTNEVESKSGTCRGCVQTMPLDDDGNVTEHTVRCDLLELTFDGGFRVIPHQQPCFGAGRPPMSPKDWVRWGGKYIANTYRLPIRGWRSHRWYSSSGS